METWQSEKEGWSSGRGEGSAKVLGPDQLAFGMISPPNLFDYSRVSNGEP